MVISFFKSLIINLHGLLFGWLMDLPIITCPTHHHVLDFLFYLSFISITFEFSLWSTNCLCVRSILTWVPVSLVLFSAWGARNLSTHGTSGQSGREHGFPRPLRSWGFESEPACQNGPRSVPGTVGTNREEMWFFFTSHSVL